MRFLERILPTLPPPDAFGPKAVYHSMALGPQTIAKAHNDIDSLEAHCSMLSAQGFDTYMAMSSFHNTPAGRKAANALECRAIWMDIDAGKPKNKYQNAQEAFTALSGFVLKTGFEPSIIVSSGRGLHGYWCFDRNIPAAVWHQMAHMYYQLCQQESLDVDPARAQDLASVLRLPGTRHQSTGRTVTVLAEGRTWTPEEFVQQLGRSLTSPVPRTNGYHHTPISSTASSSLAAAFGMGPEPPKAKAAKIVQHCGQMLTMGLGLYPKWFAGMSVLRRCVDGLEWAHKLSDMDPRYDAGDTERKFYQAAEDAPARCITFEIAEHAHICEKCRYRGQIKSPVQLSSVSDIPAQPIVDPVVVGGEPKLEMVQDRKHPYVPLISQHFKVDDRGIVMIDAEQDKKNNGAITVVEKVITPTQIYFKYSAHALVDGQHQTIHYFDAIMPSKEVRELCMIAGEHKTEQAIMKWLSSADINSHGLYTGKTFMAFFNTYLNSVAVNKTTIPIVREFGWRDAYQDPKLKHEVKGFVVGGGIITETGMHPVNHDATTTGKFAKKEFSHKGTLEKWKDSVRVYKVLNQYSAQFIIGTALAAVLLKSIRSEAQNALFNFWSNDGGRGKSSTLRAAHSVWGDPQHAFLSMDTSPTSRNRHLVTWNNLPMYIDEITDWTDEEMASFAYRMVSGMDKARLTSSAGFGLSGQWSTFSATTANRSIKEAVSRYAGHAEAPMLRLLEYECDLPVYDGIPEVQRVLEASTDLRASNYGVAGPEFLYRLLQHVDRLEYVNIFVNDWRLKNGFQDKERFLSLPCAAVILALRWAKEWGIVDFDPDEVEKWVLDKLIPHNRGATRSLTPDLGDALEVYLNFRAPQSLIVKRHFRDNAQEPDPGTNFSNIPDKFVLVRPQGETLIRAERENRMLYFSADDFRRWCQSRRFSPQAIFDALKRRGVELPKHKFDLALHVSSLQSVRMMCYSLNERALEVLGYEFPPDLPTPPPAAALSSGVDVLKNLVGG